MIRLLQSGLLVFVLVLAGCAGLLDQHAKSGTDKAAFKHSQTRAIRGVLSKQTAAWNRSDIDTFMQGYWHSPDLRFASGGTVTRGWQETSDRYHARYSDRAKMGQLNFSDLEISLLSPEAAIVHGRWQLKRENDAPSGLFTLVFRKFGDDWRIISDITTSAD